MRISSLGFTTIWSRMSPWLGRLTATSVRSFLCTPNCLPISLTLSGGGGPRTMATRRRRKRAWTWIYRHRDETINFSNFVDAELSFFCCGNKINFGVCFRVWDDSCFCVSRFHCPLIGYCLQRLKSLSYACIHIFFYMKK